MGFFDFLGHAAVHAMSDASKETKRHNELCYQLSDYNADLNNYLERVGCDAVYNADWGCIDTGSISLEKRKMDTIRRKVEEYIKIGGVPKYIHDLDEIDDCIEKVKYLKSKNALHRQEEFQHQELYWVKDDIEREEKEDREIALLLNAQGNELSTVANQGEYSFVPYRDINDSDDTIWIDTAKSYNEYTVQFLEYRTVSLKFNKKGYYVYSYDEQKQLYFKSGIRENQRIEVSALPIPAVQGWSMLVINGLELLCSTELADSVRDLYIEHNMSIIEEENTLSALAAENINNLSGIEFERVCQQLVENMGFDTETTKASGDGGIDLIAYNHQPLLSGKYIIQCKRYAGSVGEPIIRDLYGVITSERANKGILMTTGHFTKSAIAFAEGKPIELIDGIAMQNLFSQYGMNVCGGNSQVRKEYVDVTNGRAIEEVIQENFSLEDKYDEFLELKDVVDNTVEERDIAEYINWLIDKIDSDNFIIFDHSERLVFFKEINTYIKKYLDMRKTEKSELLSYLYQMIFVQNSILLEHFTDAKTMFIKMMKNEKIQFNLMETLGETHKTEEIFENTGVFSFLFATWCNMNQLAYISHDDDLRMYLSDHNLFYGVPSLQDSRIDDNLQLIESGKSNLNPVYFQKQRQLINELNSVFNEVEMTIFFRIDKTEVIESFYEYSYLGGRTKDIMLEFSDYKIENGEVVINNYGNINLNNALGAYIPFSQNDLLDC
ncbi:MAG: restriction endonuclease [Lachnospiraceae bacterium]|nr:restriction endonuclease [Lachnospiraceae bacterium]